MAVRALGSPLRRPAFLATVAAVVGMATATASTAEKIQNRIFFIMYESVSLENPAAAETV